MTILTVLLHGGYEGNWDGVGEDFTLYHRLINAATESDGKLLISLCGHAKPQDFSGLDKMLSALKSLSTTVQITVATQKDFCHLAPQHQVIFLQGSNSAGQIEFFQNQDSSVLTQNTQFLAGSSAGAIVISQCGYVLKKEVGFGIVDIAVIPHGKTWPTDNYATELSKHYDGTILIINEMESVIMKASVDA